MGKLRSLFGCCCFSSSKDAGPDVPIYFPNYRETDVEVAMPGGSRNVPIHISYKVKGTRKKNPMDPPPPQFSQPPPYLDAARRGPGQSLERPIAIYSHTDELSMGMIEVYPTVLANYEVYEEDWARFVEDIVCVAKRIPVRRQLMAGVNLNAESYNYNLYKFLMKKYGRMQYPLIKDLVAAWNRQFFNLRGLHVLFETPEEQWDVRTVQDPGYVRPKKRTEWSGVGKNQCKVITEDKVRLVITPVEMGPPRYTSGAAGASAGASASGSEKAEYTHEDEKAVA